MKNGFGLYDMAGNAAEWLWDSYYSEAGATTEYLDDNYKGPDLVIGTERFYATGRFSQSGYLNQTKWDNQFRTSATSAGTEMIVWISNYSTDYVTDGTEIISRSAPQVGLRTVRGR